MQEHPERINLPKAHLMSLAAVADHLQVDPDEYLRWVIRGEAPPLNVVADGESHVLREDLVFWLGSLTDAPDGAEPEDILGLTLSLEEVADIFGVAPGEYVAWVEAGDAPPLSTFRDGSVGVVRAALDAWAGDCPDHEDVLAMLREIHDDILEALREGGFVDPEQMLRDILGDD